MIGIGRTTTCGCIWSRRHPSNRKRCWNKCSCKGLLSQWSYGTNTWSFTVVLLNQTRSFTIMIKPLVAINLSFISYEPQTVKTAAVRYSLFSTHSSDTGSQSKPCDIRSKPSKMSQLGLAWKLPWRPLLPPNTLQLAHNNWITTIHYQYGFLLYLVDLFNVLPLWANTSTLREHVKVTPHQGNDSQRRS